MAKAITFRQCAEAYIASHRAGWRNAKHAKQWEATLARYAYPVFGHLAVEAVDTGLVHQVLDPIWASKIETAARLRGRIENVLDGATARGHRKGDNPARWKGALQSLLPARGKVRRVKHHPALPYAEMADFWAKLSEEPGTVAEALRFTILTASRTREAIEETWQEIDIEKAIWIVPADRMKAKREHRVPLAPAVVDLLRSRLSVTGGKCFLFPGLRPNKPLSNMAMLKCLERMERTRLTVHGFRSTFRDWAEETTIYGGAVAEAALAHVVGDKVKAAYRRGDLFDKRRYLMNAWISYCTEPRKDVVVISMRG